MRGQSLIRTAAQYFGGYGRVAAVATMAAFLASCTATGVPTLDMTSPAYAPTPIAAGSADTVADGADGNTDASEAGASAGAMPLTIAYLPTPNPHAPAALATASTPATATQLSAAAPATPSPETEIRLAAIESAPKPLAASATASDIPPPPPRPEAALSADHSGDPVFENPAPGAPQKPKGGFFASLFGGGGAKPAAAAPVKPRALAPKEATPVVLASAGPNAGVSLREALTGSDLPGVRKSALFEISRKSGVDDDSDVDLTEDNDPPVRLASAAGLARLAPNGLLIQHEGVETACLKPELVKRLRLIERHYGKRVVVTSGYRSPQHNRRVRGARKSLHMSCAAADIQIAGIGKWELARYARSMSDRGGVGTYCHTESVHIDIGPERDWNWRCRRSKKK